MIGPRLLIHGGVSRLGEEVWLFRDMDYQVIINKYYPEDNELRHILLVHSRAVADKALAIADRHPELSLDRQFIEEAAMLHDIGIVRCNAPGIQCFGTEPYICHGRIGAEILRAEGFLDMLAFVNVILERVSLVAKSLHKSCHFLSKTSSLKPWKRR